MFARLRFHRTSSGVASCTPNGDPSASAIRDLLERYGQDACMVAAHTTKSLDACLRLIEEENPKLTVVALHDFDGNSTLTPEWLDSVTTAAKDNRHIQAFSIRKLSAFTIEYVAPLSVLTSMNLSLRVLELASCCITDTILAGIIGTLTSHPTLVEFNVSGNFLTNADVLVTLLRYNRSIERLIVGTNNYGTTIDVLWPVLIENTVLRHIDLRCNGLVDASVHLLLPILKENALLETVGLDDNPKVERDTIVRVQRLLDMGPQRICKALLQRSDQATMTDALIDYEAMYRETKFELFEVRKELTNIKKEKERLQEKTQTEIVELRQRLRTKDNELFAVEHELMVSLEKNVALDREITKLRLLQTPAEEKTTSQQA